MREKILIVDDEREIADLVELYLQNENYEVYKFYTAQEALACIAETRLDLAVLDIMLPQTTGLEICREIRKQYSYPVIMLTAKDAEIDLINGLTVGADDYLTKPFRPLELVARVKAQLRRYKKYNNSDTNGTQKENQTLEFNGLVIDKHSHTAGLNGENLQLTPTEFDILRILLEQKGKVVSAEQMFYQIWKDEYYTKNNNTITVHIRHLREKLNDTSDKPKYIKTVWGVGYKIG